MSQTSMSQTSMSQTSMSQPSMSQPSFETMTFDHAGVSVANLDAAKQFYTEVLGFTTVSSYHDLPEHRLKILILLNAQGVRIELFEREGSTPIRTGHPSDDAQLHGWFQFALAVQDVEATHDRVVAAGARSCLSPRVSPDGRTKIAFIADPDNNLIEFIERRAA